VKRRDELAFSRSHVRLSKAPISWAFHRVANILTSAPFERSEPFSTRSAMHWRAPLFPSPRKEDQVPVWIANNERARAPRFRFEAVVKFDASRLELKKERLRVVQRNRGG
jgi:hypothetical protein